MKKPLYILRSGRLRRKENTIVFEQEMGDASSEKLNKKVIPIEVIDSIYLFGEIDLNVKAINFIAQNNIPIHFFDYYGHYTGTFYPREHLISGYLVIKQVEFYLKEDLRLEIAKEIVRAGNHNILKTLKYYQSRYGGLNSVVDEIESLSGKIESINSISELMGIEGRIRRGYFSAWDIVIKSDEEFMKFERRERKPPSNPVNALISFGNSLLYTTVLDEIYKTQMNPAISYLHEPSEKRFSLSLDISEIFKPLLVDRTIFNMINHREIKSEHFEAELNFAYLNDKGRRVFISKFDEKLQTTIKHPRLKRSVSYKTLIRLECYKLMKHILGEEKYEGFKMWW